MDWLGWRMEGSVLLATLLMLCHLQTTAGQFPTVVFAEDTYEVLEGEDLEVCLEITDIPPELTQDLNVLIDAYPVTADSDDYASVFPLVVIFIPGDTSGTVRCAPQKVAAINDLEQEGNEHFRLAIRFSMLFSLNGFPTIISVFIDDDDDDTVVALSAAKYTASESDTSVEICALLSLFAVEFPSGLPAPITVELSTADDTAVAPADYTSVSAEVLTFPVGSANGGMQCRNITIIDDHSLEPPENFTVTISNLLYSGEDARIGSPSTAVVDVEDSTAAALFVIFEECPYVTSEAEGLVTVCLRIESLGDLVSIDREITFNFDTTDMTAVEGEDYMLMDTVIIFPEMTVIGTLACANITIIDDSILEPDQEFTVQVVDSDPPGVVSRELSTTVTIEDNDTVLVGFEEATFFVEESAVILLYQLHIWGWLERDVTVDIRTTNGTAILGEDFREPEYSSFTFHLGIHGHLYHWLHLFIISDVYYEGEENLHLVLSSTDPSVEISLSMAEVIIWDDDTVVLGLQQEEYTVCEGSGYVTVCLELFSGHLASTVLEISANISTQNYSAQCGVDYGSVEDYPLVIPGGSGPGSVSCVNISIIDDSIVEYNETFTVSLSFESLDNVTFDPTEAKVTIKDDDTIHFGFEEANYSVSEGTGSVQYHLVFWGWLEREIIITVSAVEGSAELDQDYEEPENPTIAISAGAHGRIEFWCNVSITDDDLFENKETFVLSLTAEDPSAVVFNESQAEVSIDDDDTVVYSLQRETYSRCETNEAGGVQVCIVQTFGELGDGTAVTLHFETYDIPGYQAHAGVDYTAASMDVSITTGSNESCPLILFTNDTIEEDCGDEVFGVNLTAVSPRVTIGNGTSLVNIADDDQPGDFSISLVNDTPMVSGGNVTVDVEVGGACPDRFECTIDGLETDCTASTLFQLNIRPEIYTLEVEAFPVCASAGSVSLSREFRTDNPIQCSAHFINEVVVDPVNMTATFEWEGTGPNSTIQVSNFQCRLDDGSYQPCGLPDQNVNNETISIDSLATGEHRYRVRPVNSELTELGCDGRRRGSIFFNV